MNANEFKEYINTKPDKITALRESANKLNFSLKELLDIIVKDFSDEEKARFIFSFEKLSIIFKLEILKSIKNSTIRFDLLKNKKISEKLMHRDIINIINNLSDENKLQILYDNELKQQFQLTIHEIVDIINTMDNHIKEKLLDNKERLLSILENNIYELINIIKKLEDENKRFEYAEIYKLEIDEIVNIVISCSDKKKEEILLSNKYPFDNRNIVIILSKFNVQNLNEFIDNNHIFIENNNIKIYQVVSAFSEDKQVEFISKMDTTNLSFEDKLKCLAVINQNAKKRIDKSILNERYIEVLEMSIIDSTEDYGNINLDLDGDLSKYKDLDDLITIRPQDVPIEKHSKLKELATICPKLKVVDNIGQQYSTAQEFLNGEKWIDEILSNIDSKWSDVKKIAYIDYMIGKRVSYTPDFDTEVFDEASAKAVWKIIDSGYGICYGVAQLEQYILKRVGIESELVSSEDHTFLKLKNITIPGEDGTSMVGDSIIDPTWNLSAHRYNMYPNYFLKNYEEIRKCDIEKDGTDGEYHKNDEAFSTPTIEIEEKVLREIFKSLGLTRKDGIFLVGDLMEQSDELAKKNISLEQKLEEQLSLLQKVNPNFATCQNSTISILSDILLDHPEMSFKRVVINRVYNKNDKNKTPAIYIYCDLGDEKDIFFVSEPGSGAFSKMNKDDFIKCYECYDYDLKKAKGIRPWEKRAIDTEKNLNNSSRIATEGGR